jgi:hypothetical protein
MLSQMSSCVKDGKQGDLIRHYARPQPAGPTEYRVAV